MKFDLVLYHALSATKPCTDGFGAAWAAYKSNPAIQHVGVQHGPEMRWPDVTDRKVLIADIVPPRSELVAMHEQADELVVLDHHKTAQAALEGLEYCIFDMNRSGAMLAWEYLHPGPPPLLIEYVQDRDLWRNSLPQIEAVSTYINSVPTTFSDWDVLAVNIEDPERRASVMRAGKSLLDYKMAQVHEIVENAVFIDTAIGPCGVVNSPINQSEIGNILATKCNGWSTVWWLMGHTVHFSFRSIGIDVSAVAKVMGGGGHRQASGAEVPMGLAFPISKVILEAAEEASRP